MKRHTPFLTAIAAGMLLAAAASSGVAGEPGLVEFGKFARSTTGGTFVEVNISKSLISLVSKMVPENEPEVGKLLNGLHQIRVNVVGLDDSNRADVEKRSLEIRKNLDSNGWDRIVAAQKDSQDVGVYLKMLGDDTIAGLAIVALDGKQQAVFINIVGNIKPEQIGTVGERFNIDPLKKFGQSAQKDTPAAKAE
jgi:hypothetical protein